jgi:hypothetical protein
MTTLNDDLHLALSWAQTTYPSTPSEVVNDSVYINYDYATAVVVDVEYTTAGKVWNAEALAWDRTGGVSDEHFIAMGGLPHVLREIAQFLMQEATKQDELEAVLSQRPEDM